MMGKRDRSQPLEKMPMLTIRKNGQAINLSESDIHEMLEAFEYALADNANKLPRTFGCFTVKGLNSGVPDSGRHQMKDMRGTTQF